jgi:magnesium transporter
MIFLSALLRQSVYDNEDRRVGIINDVCVSLNETFPVVTALMLHPATGNGNGNAIIPWTQVNSIEESSVHLTVDHTHMASYTPRTDEVLLKRDILDKQIVDTQGFRVVKVNDLKLAQIKKTARLVGVDISPSGLLRRLSGQKLVDVLSHIMPVGLSERTITWNYVEPIQVVKMGTGQLTPVLAGAAGAAVASAGVVPQVQLSVSHNKLTELHPADIADILEQLDIEEAGAVLDRLDTETAADTLNEVETPLQSELISGLDPERASDLLERLAPDDAADILADIPRAEAEHLLNLMPAHESQPIRDLLRYGAQTAGGIMTNEVLALSEEATVEEALVYLRQNSNHLEMVYYLYIIDGDRHLQGVVSLRQLVTAEPTARMADLMDRDVIKVQTSTDQEEVARIIAKYDLLGVPVVDNDNHLVGLITVDDAIDVIHEEDAEDFSEIAGTEVDKGEEEERFSWRIATSRFSWYAVNVLAGFLLAVIISRVFSPIVASGTALVSLTSLAGIGQSRQALSGLICLVPMLLLTSGTAGSQTLGVAGWRLRTKRVRDLLSSLWHELLLGTFGGVLVSVLVGVLTWLLFRLPALSIAVGLGFGFALLTASICGLILPNIFRRLHFRGSLITAPLLDPVIATVSLCIFLAITLAILNGLAG